MAEVNLIFGWAWVLVGVVVGAVMGMFFAREEWLGGYGSWRRRMVRLGHIAFMGMAAVNIGFALTVSGSAPGSAFGDGFSQEGVVLCVASICFLVGGIGMPVVCLLSAWKKSWRHAFCLPVVALVVGLGSLLVALMLRTN